MVKLRGDLHKTLHELGVSYEDAIELEELKEGEKISIVSDSMMKTMFQNENRIKYSAKLLSYYLDITFEELLENLHLSKNELDKKKEKSKEEKCDYVAVIGDTTINIEVNNNGSLATLERNMEYAYRLYSKLVRKGKRINNYTQVIQFNLNNFSFKSNDKIVDVYSVQNDDKIRYSNKLIFVQIYIPNLIRKWYTKGIQELDESERYLLALVLRNIEDSKSVGKGIKIMEEYVEEAEEVILDEDLRESYDKELALKELWLEEGLNKGIEQGIQKGIEQGIEQGVQQGIEQGVQKNSKEIAKRMKKDGLPTDTIIKYTNLTKEEIEKL